MGRIIEGFDGNHASAYDVQDYVRVVQETSRMMTEGGGITPVRRPATMVSGFHGVDGRNMTAEDAARMTFIRRGRRR